MYRVIIIIHNEDSKSDIFYGVLERKHWIMLRNMESRRMGTYSEDEVDLIERIGFGQIETVYKIDRFVRKKNLSVFQIWSY